MTERLCHSQSQIAAIGQRPPASSLLLCQDLPYSPRICCGGGKYGVIESWLDFLWPVRCLQVAIYVEITAEEIQRPSQVGFLTEMAVYELQICPLTGGCYDRNKTSHLWLEAVAKPGGGACFRPKRARSPCFSVASFTVAWSSHHFSATLSLPSFFHDVAVSASSNHLAKVVTFPMRNRRRALVAMLSHNFALPPRQGAPSACRSW